MNTNPTWMVDISYRGGKVEQYYAVVAEPTLVDGKMIKIPVDNNTALYVNTDLVASMRVTNRASTAS